MKRAWLFLVPVLIVALFVASRTANGQDNSDDRISALETQVAELRDLLGLAQTPTPVGGSHRLDGVIALVGASAIEVRTPVPQGSESECQGGGIYSEIKPNAQVTLLDDAERTIGSGSLGHGEYQVSGSDDPECTFTFFVSQVPPHTRYTIVIGTRAVFLFTYEEMQDADWSISLTLG